MRRIIFETKPSKHLGQCFRYSKLKGISKQAMYANFVLCRSVGLVKMSGNSWWASLKGRMLSLIAKKTDRASWTVEFKRLLDLAKIPFFIPVLEI